MRPVERSVRHTAAQEREITGGADAGFGGRHFQVPERAFK